MLGNTDSIFRSSWPVCDENALIVDTLEIPVQVNDKVRAVVKVAREAEKEEVIDTAAKAITKYTDGKTVVKTIYVPGKILNFIVK